MVTKWLVQNFLPQFGPKNIKEEFHVRGRPLMYGVTMMNPITTPSCHTLLEEEAFTNNRKVKELPYRQGSRNISTISVAVAVSHNGSGALDLYLGGSGPQLLTVVGSGDVNIHIGTDCTGLVTLNIHGTGIVTIYVPMGQSPPQVTGGGDYIIVYYPPRRSG